MSASGNARGMLDSLMRMGAVERWSAQPSRNGKHTDFVVIGNDGKQHLWRPSEVQAFYAGACAGISIERARAAL